jgi:formiminotetrahydrofolate cyclodeaminase
MRAIVEEADGAREEFLDLADRDAQAFDGVMAAYRMPKASDAERAARSAAIERALTWAAQVPMEVARRAVAVLDLAREVTAAGLQSAASDGATAGHLLTAATEGALANVRINAGSMKDAEQAERMRTEADALHARGADLLAATVAAFGERTA